MAGVARDDLRLVAALVGERDLDLLSAGDHVVVGEDVALLVEDEAGALVLLGNGLEEEVVAPARRR